MCLMTDPRAVISDLKKGKFTRKQAEKHVSDIIAEIESGIWDMDYLGIKKHQLKKLIPKNNVKSR